MSKYITRDDKGDISDVDWAEVLIDASISALQGIQESKIGIAADIVPSVFADRAVTIAEALVDRLKSAIKV